ncbi:MAG TPA: hypothetical protein VFZ59_19545 [Verrucomicrobiae bacterium]|nr:hypothetical protein [Verrucomicrobiae bacterium]
MSMYSIVGKRRFSFKGCQRQISKQLADCVFASQRAMRETERRILKKLAARMRASSTQSVL